MYVVVLGQKIVYLGDSEKDAVNLYSEISSNLDIDANFGVVDNLNDLKNMIFPKKPVDEKSIDEKETKNLLDSLYKKLDSLIDENLESSKNLYENFGKVIAEVKPLGMKGMRAVGEGFIAIGDLLKENSK